MSKDDEKPLPPAAKPAVKDELKTLPLPELEKKLASTPDGLSQAEAAKRLAAREGLPA